MECQIPELHFLRRENLDLFLRWGQFYYFSAGCGAGFFPFSFLKNEEETKIQDRFSFICDARDLNQIFMCMSIIQGVGMCGERKSGFLCRNCVFLLKVYFISQIPFLWQQSLKGSVLLAVNPCFYECDFDGIREWFPISSHEIFKRQRERLDISIPFLNIPPGRVGDTQRRWGKIGNESITVSTSHSYKGIRLSPSPASSLPLPLPLDVPLECRESRNFKSPSLLNPVYCTQQLQISPLSSKPHIIPLRFQLLPKFYLRMEPVELFPGVFWPLFQPCFPVDALINYSSNLNERFNSTVAS